jgi:hypothetical protein
MFSSWRQVIFLPLRISISFAQVSNLLFFIDRSGHA